MWENLLFRSPSFLLLAQVLRPFLSSLLLVLLEAGEGERPLKAKRLTMKKIDAGVVDALKNTQPALAQNQADKIKIAREPFWARLHFKFYVAHCIYPCGDERPASEKRVIECSQSCTPFVNLLLSSTLACYLPRRSPY